MAHKDPEIRRQYNKARYQLNKEAKQRYNADYRTRMVAEQPEKELLYSSRARAKERGIEHTLTSADIFVPSHCPVLGFELARSLENNRDTSPSLDRIDPSKGYTPDNVWVISFRAKRIKNDATLDELQLLCRALAAKIADGL